MRIFDVQGWCPADRFIEDVQDVQEICYIMEESVKECLEANDYEVLEELPIEIYNIINRQAEVNRGTDKRQTETKLD